MDMLMAAMQDAFPVQLTRILVHVQGLDPASRHNLWDVVKEAKKGRGIILTTHSMEEATVLCDRLGIFVNGQLVCIGNPKELTARYGGYYVSVRIKTGRCNEGNLTVFLRAVPHPSF